MYQRDVPEAYKLLSKVIGDTERRNPNSDMIKKVERNTMHQNFNK